MTLFRHKGWPAFPVIFMRTILVILLCCLLSLSGVMPARAAESSIAVVDVVRILSQSKAAISVQKQRETLRQEFLDEISKTEQALSREERDLTRTAAQMPQEQYEKRRLAYEEKLVDTRKFAQSRKHALEDASNRAMNHLRDQLYLVVQEIANERGYSLVISNQNVIAGEKSLDITEETLRRLDRRVEDIPLNLDKMEAR